MLRGEESEITDLRFQRKNGPLGERALPITATGPVALQCGGGEEKLPYLPNLPKLDSGVLDDGVESGRE